MGPWVGATEVGYRAWQATDSLPPGAHHDPCPGTLFYYTLLLYGTGEDMTARPQGPQVTSRACVQRDTEGLCQGEWPQRMVTCRGRRRSGPGWVGGHWLSPPRQPHPIPILSLYRKPCSPRRPGLALPPLRPAAVAPQPHRAASDRGTGQLSPSCYTCWGDLTSDCTACPLSLVLDEPQGSSKACHLRRPPRLPVPGHGAGPAGRAFRRPLWA